jgi:flagellar hook assembly protein FlgD
LYAYPNPVPPNFDGDISIKGVSENAEIKITDITGNLVYETFANGGFVSWNGKDLSGKKVQSGVYLVLASNTDGSDTQITKILFINGK